MFKFIFKHRGKAATVEQKLAMQREIERRRVMEQRYESALRANIANKLKSYNVEEDTTISNFTLAEDEVERRLSNKPSVARGQDIWSQTNPRETGRWKKENRIHRRK
jgi:hypothetical protein